MYRQGRIYDAKSFDVLVNSLKDSFVNSRTLKQNGMNVADAAVTVYGAYLQQELTYIIPTVLKQEFPDKPALSIFSVSNEGALEKILIRKMKSFSGLHTREIENKTQPKGVIAVGYDATGIKVEEFGAISNYKESDLLRSAMLGDPLDASIIEAHDESYKTVADQIAWLGMSNEAGTTLVEGLLNNSNVDSSLQGNATGTFTTASGQTMYNDIKAMVATQHGACKGTTSLHVDTLVTSPRVYSLLASTTYGTSSTADYQNPMTVLEMVKKNLGITGVYATSHATGLDTGVGGTDRLVLFNRQPKVMQLYIPKPLTFSEVFKRTFNYEIESMFRIAGLGINQKVGFAYLKGC
jgi:hypothetical protein